MEAHGNIPMLEQVLACATPDEHEQVKNYFRNLVNESVESNNSVLLDYSGFSPPMREKAGQMLYREYRYSQAERRAGRDRKRWELCSADFMLEIEDYLSGHPSLDSDRYYFEAADCTVKQRCLTGKKASSIDETVDELCRFVREALHSPLKAGHMAQDSCLPHWLQAFAAAIIEPGFRSGLRKEVEQALDDLAHARSWEATAREDGLPDWMAEMFHVLGMRRST